MILDVYISFGWIQNFVIPTNSSCNPKSQSNSVCEGTKDIILLYLHIIKLALNPYYILISFVVDFEWLSVVISKKYTPLL